MTETQADYITNRDNAIAQEAGRVSHLERDKLIYQVSGECCGNQQELIERLADLVILARKWRRVCGDVG